MMEMLKSYVNGCWVQMNHVLLIVIWRWNSISICANPVFQKMQMVE